MRSAGQYAATSRMDIAQTVSDFSKTHPHRKWGSLLGRVKPALTGVDKLVKKNSS
jgi:hypothetical protein